MARFRVLFVVVLAVGLLLACSPSRRGEAGGAAEKAASGQAEGAGGVVASLLDMALELVPSAEQGAAKSGPSAAAVPDTKVEEEPIVRCEVKGKVSYTHQSRCDNAGGQGVKMALKKK